MVNDERQRVDGECGIGELARDGHREAATTRGTAVATTGVAARTTAAQRALNADRAVAFRGQNMLRKAIGWQNQPK